MPWKELGYAIGFVVLLAAIYVGAYYATVEPATLWLGPYPNQDKMAIPTYHLPNCESFFSPAHEMDKRLRPDVWYVDIAPE
jgi:hypothetical protein